MPGKYLHWLRERVGRRKILLVLGCAALRDGGGRLLWRRREEIDGWGLPAAALELDESLPECAARALAELTRAMAVRSRLVGIYSSPDFDFEEPNGDEAQPVAACFEFRPGEATTGGGAGEGPAGFGAGEESAWFAAGEIPKTLPLFRAAAEDLFLDAPEASFARGSPGARGGEPFSVWMRREVGREPFVMPAAAAFVRDEAGRVLLHQRTDTGEWSLPGGQMEVGERIDRTVVEEVREETGLEVEPLKIVGLYSDQTYWLRYPHGDELKVASALFECRPMGGRLGGDASESLAARFFAREELPPLGPRQLPRVLDGFAARPGARF